MAVSAQQYIESLPILTCIYNGTATTQYHLNPVWYIPFIIGPKLFVQAQSCYKKKKKNLSEVLTKCKYPAWALNRMKIKTKAPAKINNRSSTNSSVNNNNWNPYMVVPYYKGLIESLKRTCRKHGVQVNFKGGMTIKNLLVAPKDKNPILKRVDSYTDTNVTGWSVMRSILGNLPEHLERGSKNIKRPLPQYLTIITSLVTMSP